MHEVHGSSILEVHNEIRAKVDPPASNMEIMASHLHTLFSKVIAFPYH